MLNNPVTATSSQLFCFYTVGFIILSIIAQIVTIREKINFVMADETEMFEVHVKM